MSQTTEYSITPPSRWPGIDWSELYRFRDLFLVFVWRDVAIRYKQTVLGVLWVIFQPLITMVIFTVIFNRVVGIESGSNTPYPIFLYVGLLLWQYYAGALIGISNSMVQNAGLIQKVYFPRLILPGASALTGLVDMIIGGIILLGMMVYYRCFPHLLGLLLLPVLVAILMCSALGLGMLMASLNIKYRDVRYALPFFVQVLMYVTPVIYPVSMLDKYPLVKSLMVWLNPPAGAITAARATLLGDGAVDWGMLAISLGMSLVYLLCGLIYFRSTERYFADII